MPANLNLRKNIYVLIDEAHRTTGGDLGNFLMAGLPNATFIGFTGTPVDKTVYGKGTFKTFGCEDDQGYLHKYSIADSIEDGTTLPLYYQLAPNEMLVPHETLDKEFLSLAEAEGVADIEELNKSPNGSYHQGREGDIVTVKSDKHMDFQYVRLVLEDYVRQIAQAFLLNSAVTRDAERVTAEEIRYQAQELEMAYGGIYSRFTEDWQEPVARLLLSRQQVTVGDDTIFPTIVTGMDTLSRMGDLDNYRMFMDDLSILNNVPEVLQRYIL
jgi:type I site-specific restriction-modification system R (restriction) subunit